MEKRNQVVLMPQYMKEFLCLGSDCEANCCGGWYINIDQETYHKYQQLPDIKWRELLIGNIRINRFNGTPTNYARIKLTRNNKKCPFLSGEGLCRVQLELGVDYLSPICLNYPRKLNKVNGRLEKSAALSCPEAARLALLNPAGMIFKEVEEDLSECPVTESRANKAEAYLLEIRSFTINLLQNRSFSLTHRLIMLGVFCEKLQEYIQTDKTAQIPLLISTPINHLNQEAAKRTLMTDSLQPHRQMQLFLKLIAKKRFYKKKSDDAYGECIREILSGLQHTKEIPIEELLERYEEAFNNYYQPFMAEHHYILENYLVNYVFRNLFPFTGLPSILDEYIILIIYYTLIKMHLVGMASFHQELNSNLIIKLIYSFTRLIGHCEEYANYALNLFKGSGYNNAASLVALMKK